MIRTIEKWSRGTVMNPDGVLLGTVKAGSKEKIWRHLGGVAPTCPVSPFN